MPNYLKALVVVLFFAAIVYLVYPRVAARDEIPLGDFPRRRNTWFTLTLITFLPLNFWIFATSACAFLWKKSSRDSNPLAFYALLLLVLPPFIVPIPMVGGLNMLFELTNIRLLNISILLPIAVRIFQKALPDGDRLKKVDFLIVLLLLIQFVAQFRQLESATAIVRVAFYICIDSWLPYYVASRAIRSKEQFYDLASAFVIASAIVGLCAVFESIRHWNLYDEVGSLQEVTRTGGSPYLLRGDGGPVRARATASQPIALGYFLMIGLLMWVLTNKARPLKFSRIIFPGMIIAGLLASISRGPWVGAALALLFYYCLGPQLGKRIASLIGIGGVAILGLLATPVGDSIIAYLPFVGTVEPGSVDYRTRLFDVSMEVLKQNPIFGDPAYILNPLMEQMRQGEGIIDVVNTYLGYALPYGVFGLFVFLLPYAIVMKNLWRLQRREMQRDSNFEQLARTLLATLIGILVTIGTVSSIGAIPTLYIIFLGLGCSLICMIDAPIHNKTSHRAPRKTLA